MHARVLLIVSKVPWKVYSKIRNVYVDIIKGCKNIIPEKFCNSPRMNDKCHKAYVNKQNIVIQSWYLCSVPHFLIINSCQLRILGDTRSFKAQESAVIFLAWTCGQCLLFSAVAESGSKIFEVDYGNLHTNLLIIKINCQQITAQKFCDRLTMVSI